MKTNRHVYSDTTKVEKRSMRDRGTVFTVNMHKTKCSGKWITVARVYNRYSTTFTN